MKLQSFLITCLESVLLVFIGTGCIQAQNVTYSGNLQFATGSYFFTERTESIYFTNGLSLSGDYLRVSLTIPYVIQSTPWISYSPGGVIPTGGTGHGRVGRGMNGSMSMNQDQDKIRHGKHRIDIPDTVSYRQTSFSDPGLSGSLRLYNSFSRNTTLNLGSAKMIDDFEPPMSLNIGLGHFVSSRVSFSGSVSFGLTESSPDISAGAGWSIQL